MRAIFVNHCHPDCPHICGTRAREFANALARQGHRVLLLTETLRRTDPASDPVLLPGALAAHDWQSPFRLAVRPKPAPVLEALRAGRLPAPLRAAVIAYQYLVRGGMFTDWRDASRDYWRPLVEAFQPDIVWGIFGNTDAWAIAQGIAREAGCPWVRDVKDQWTAFIPAPFRASLSRRYAGAAGATALSGANASDSAPWFPGHTHVIYSGVPDSLLAPATAGLTNEPFTLALVGALYDADATRMLVDGLRRFLDASGDENVLVIYAGTDSERAADALKPLAHRLRVEIRGQMPFSEYGRIVARADANLYVRTGKAGWWHHKIVELLAVRRPIICLPDEIEEAHQLVRSVGGRLFGCANAEAVAAALTTIRREAAVQTRNATDDIALRSLGWDVRAGALSNALAAMAPGQSA